MNTKQLIFALSLVSLLGTGLALPTIAAAHGDRQDRHRVENGHHKSDWRSGGYERLDHIGHHHWKKHHRHHHDHHRRLAVYRPHHHHHYHYDRYWLPWSR